jgi:hypothetical protein
MLGNLPDEDFALVGKADDRRRQPAALGVDQDLGLITLHDCDNAVGSSKVNSNYLCHNVISSRDAERAAHTGRAMLTLSQRMCHRTPVSPYPQTLDFKWLIRGLGSSLQRPPYAISTVQQIPLPLWQCGR